MDGLSLLYHNVMVSSADTAAMRQLLTRMATKVFMVLQGFDTEVRIYYSQLVLLFAFNYLTMDQITFCILGHNKVHRKEEEINISIFGLYF